MENSIDIGKIVASTLARKHMTKQDLGRRLGISGSAATYLTTRDTIDVKMLHRIGTILQYNFFKHFPIEEKEGIDLQKVPPQDEEKKKLTERIAELEKQLEACKRDLTMQKQENVYLKKINELLEKKSH